VGLKLVMGSERLKEEEKRAKRWGWWRQYVLESTAEH
jgi:hypothetical protein